MSDQVKLLNHARTMRNVARQRRSTARQLLEAKVQEFILSYADIVEFQADDLERLAMETRKAPPLFDRRRSPLVSIE